MDAVDGRMGFKRGERGNYSGYGSPECASLDAGPVEMLEPLLAALSSGEATPDVSLRQLVRTFPEGLPMRHRAKVWNLMLGLDGKQAKAVVQLDRARLDEPNQRVIKSDVERTRAHIPFFARPETRADLEAILTYFCKVKNLRYKQGLNEVLGPLYYLKSDEFDIAGVFTLFYAFVSRYLPVYQDEDFTTLQCTFHLFNHLLLYHDPALAVFLRDNGVSPELYVTPWFLTAFASKTQINHLLCLWDYYIAEDDRFFYCFIALALLVLYRELLFETEVSQIPETLTRITIQSFEDLQRVSVGSCPDPALEARQAAEGDDSKFLRLPHVALPSAEGSRTPQIGRRVCFLFVVSRRSEALCGLIRGTDGVEAMEAAHSRHSIGMGVVQRPATARNPP